MIPITADAWYGCGCLLVVRLGAGRGSTVLAEIFV